MDNQNEKIKLLFVTGFYPPIPGGTGVIIKNLLSGLPKGIIAGIATLSSKGMPLNDPDLGIPICQLFKLQNIFMHRGERIIRKILFPRELNKLKKFANSIGATHIIGVYPDLEFLSLAMNCANSLSLKFIPYLHDTISEGLSHTRYKTEATKLQNLVFKQKSPILVMSDGMKELYKKKYDIDSIPIRHSYPEIIDPAGNYSGNIENNIFWGGEIYSINKNSFRRISNTRLKHFLEMEVASTTTTEALQTLGINTQQLSINLYSRKDYINTIKKKGFLLLALDWPDESTVHEDELSTIFPTKTIEYLATGRPIIVHCPSHYFLATFIRKYDCGYIIESRDQQEIEDKLAIIISDKKGHKLKSHNAIETLKIFALNKIAGEFMDAITVKC